MIQWVRDDSCGSSRIAIGARANGAAPRIDSATQFEVKNPGACVLIARRSSESSNVRVAFLLTRFPVLSQTFVLNQITGLLSRGVDVEIIAGRSTEPTPTSGPVIEHRLLERTRFIELPASLLGQLASAFRRTLANPADDPKLVVRSLNAFRYGYTAASGQLLHAATDLPRGLRYDVVHAHFGPTGILGMALSELGVVDGPLSTVFHGFDMTEVFRLFGKSYYERLFSHAGLLLPISERWRSELLAMGAPAERTHVHHMGIDTAHFAPPPAPRSGRRPVRLLSVGRLVEKKGFADAIEAVARVPRALPIRYRIIGTGPLEADLRRTIARREVSDRVELLGAQSHDAVRSAMLESDILLAPSVTARNGDQEGIPVTIMEAMAMELPIAATLHSGIPELVTHGESGTLVPERNPPALAHAIEQLATNESLRITMGRAGRLFVLREFDIDRLNDRLLDRFRTLAHG